MNYYYVENFTIFSEGVLGAIPRSCVLKHKREKEFTKSQAVIITLKNISCLLIKNLKLTSK